MEPRYNCYILLVTCHSRGSQLRVRMTMNQVNVKVTDLIDIQTSVKAKAAIGQRKKFGVSSERKRRADLWRSLYKRTRSPVQSALQSITNQCKSASVNEMKYREPHKGQLHVYACVSNRGSSRSTDYLQIRCNHGAGLKWRKENR
ncbi:hypothetical protein KM043_016561 [Ampulex compressa]|nr:hypothetical protein KM043_016561 [Ampulex compressa]